MNTTVLIKELSIKTEVITVFKAELLFKGSMPTVISRDNANDLKRAVNTYTLGGDYTFVKAWSEQTTKIAELA